MVPPIAQTTITAVTASALFSYPLRVAGIMIVLLAFYRKCLGFQSQGPLPHFQHGIYHQRDYDGDKGFRPYEYISFCLDAPGSLRVHDLKSILPHYINHLECGKEYIGGLVMQPALLHCRADFLVGRCLKKPVKKYQQNSGC